VSVACILLAATAMLVTFSSQPAAAGTVVASTPATWYFAEGYTGSGFQEYLCVANPSASTASVVAIFMFKGGGSEHKTFTVKPLSRYTVDVNATVGQDREVSVVLSWQSRECSP
jgi:P pilus assembly chaperone PapD